MAAATALDTIPEELLDGILQWLSKPDLGSLCLASRWAYQKAAPFIWRELNLMDCRKNHGEADESWPDWEPGERICDEHDDTPLIRKLVLMATKPWLASHVQVVIHRCHLPLPAIFNELCMQSFSGQTLSCDPRTIHLVRLATRNMTRVHTLRIILGHASLTDALLRCFFDSSRKRQGCTSVRKLWLESCRINVGCSKSIRPHPCGLPVDSDFSGLESVRFRRLPIANPPFDIWARMWSVYSRHWTDLDLMYQDGEGSLYATSISEVYRETCFDDHRDHNGTKCVLLFDDPIICGRLYQRFARPQALDDRIYAKISADINFPQEVIHIGSLSRSKRYWLSFRGNNLDPSAPVDYGSPCPLSDVEREHQPSPSAAVDLLTSCSATLTSLNLDWVLTTLSNHPSPIDEPGYAHNRFSLFLRIFDLRFPNLKAFQVRNCVVPNTHLPNHLFLLDFAIPSGVPLDSLSDTDVLAPLRFLEAHPKLECLAWPMDRFYSNRPVSTISFDLQSRVDDVIEHLGRTLLDLRVDSLYSDAGEPQASTIDFNDTGSQFRRRRFIEHFCARMTKLTSIKIEGGVSRDERREALRALRACPLSKVVLIGVCSPLGNTWGTSASDVLPTVIEDSNFLGLEPEHTDAISDLGLKSPFEVCAPASTPFNASYGWPPSPPLLHTIASLHASTIRELKFCGYKGSPILHNPTPITIPFLSALKHFHSLESLILGMWLPTMFEDSHRDDEVISYWLNARSPTSTALVAVAENEDSPFAVGDEDAPDPADQADGVPDDPPGPSTWPHLLRTRFAPDVMAKAVTSFLGPLLSPRAKARREGVHVRASFCIGDYGGIFDLDLRIRAPAPASADTTPGDGAEQVGRDVCLGFEGPRTELEEGRRRGKLEARRWF